MDFVRKAIVWSLPMAVDSLSAGKGEDKERGIIEAQCRPEGRPFLRGVSTRKRATFGAPPPSNLKHDGNSTERR